MKKVVLLMMVVVISMTAGAQLVTSTTLVKEKKEVTGSGMFGEAGIGKIKDADGISFDLALGYRKVYSPYVAWDVIKVGAMANIENLSETITPALLTGIRGTSPELFAGMTTYGSFSTGYGYWIDGEEGGFVYEIQAGINLLPNLSAGIVYKSQAIGDGDYGFDLKFTGLRIGYTF